MLFDAVEVLEPFTLFQLVFSLFSPSQHAIKNKPIEMAEKKMCPLDNSGCSWTPTARIWHFALTFTYAQLKVVQVSVGHLEYKCVVDAVCARA